MEQTIDNVDYSQTDFKHLETTKDLVLNLKNQFGDPYRPDTSHKWTLKVANSTGYIDDYAIKVDNTDLVVDSADFTQLAPGNYYFEVWEQWKDDNGDELSIYPSPKKMIPFTINPNIPDTLGEQIKQIGVQDVINKAVESAGLNLIVKTTPGDTGTNPKVDQKYQDGKNIVTITIPKGDQGEPGTTPHIDPASGDWFLGDKDTKVHAKGDTGERGFQGPAGKNFEIKQTFASVQAMNDSKGKGFDDGDFTMIASNIEDPDNAKLYVWDGKAFKYIGDLSGAQGMKGDVGPAPTIHMGTVTKLAPGAQPTAELVPTGPGNYILNVGLPQGVKGDPGTNAADYDKVLADLKKFTTDYIDNYINNGKW